MSRRSAKAFVVTGLCLSLVAGFAGTPWVLFSSCVCNQAFVVMYPCTSIFFSAILNVCHIQIQLFAGRVEDFWQGYKLFCYAFYSHSVEHESEFRHSKLGAENLP